MVGLLFDLPLEVLDHDSHRDIVDILESLPSAEGAS
jgi:hypothetical protein